MAVESCSCSLTGNTGLPNCETIESVAKKVIWVPLFKSDGTANNIDLSSDTLNQAFFDSKTEDLDAQQRWYPSPEIKNIVDERGDDIVETADDTTDFFVQEGSRTFTGLIFKQSPRYLKNLRGLRCQKLGAYIIDKNGNLIGNGKEGSNILSPIVINEETLRFKLVKATDTTVQKVQIDWTWDSLENDADIAMITANNVDIDLFTLKGLLDANATLVGTVSQTGFVFTLTSDYGSHGNKDTIDGQLLADFAVFNITDDPTETTNILTAVTESPDGTYTTTYASQDVSDVLRLRHVDSVEGGFDYAQLPTVTLTVV